MPSGDTAEGKAGQRQRNRGRSATIESAGGPRPDSKTPPPLSWYADNLESLTWEDVAEHAELVGTMECLVASGSQSTGGMTVQVQVLPAYIHDAVDMVQRSAQGVIIARMYQVPWEVFKQDTPAWSHLAAPDDNEWGDDG